ncbi:signal peptidase I [uncultured Vagococcus sp.]|uniref:signal peptidase I n=1 Tax=uncultured Vagococcus sp. TaxID=189676 RepID=UPI00258CC33F|nr:signal peptidase I [uncultured Vagococcus sp.]
MASTNKKHKEVTKKDIKRARKEANQFMEDYNQWIIKGASLKKDIHIYCKNHPVSKENKKNLRIISNHLSHSSKKAQSLKKNFKREAIFEKKLLQNPIRQSGSTKKKASRIEALIFYTIIAFTLIIISTVLTGSDKSGMPRNIGGYAPLTVLTKSMQSVYPKDSFLLVKVTEPKSLKIGDDITFIKENNSTVTHRIIGIEENFQGSGQRGFETKGVENPRADEEIVIADNVIGKVTFSSPKIGKVLVIVRKNLWLTAILLIISIFFIDSLITLLKASR